MRTFSPMIDSTETSMSSPIMIDWLDLRVRTSTATSLPPTDTSYASSFNARPAQTLRYSQRDFMARRSLRPHLNQIRSWVRQERTDAWIAHQLEVTVQQIQSFKRENGLTTDGEAAAAADFDDEIDLRAEDDAAIAAELDAAEAARAEADDAEEDGDSDEDGEEDAKPRR